MPHLDGLREGARFPSRSGRGRRRILVVDDNPGLRALLKAVFLTEGHDAVEARDGAEATALIEDTLVARPESPPFDVVLSDVHMPTRSGLDVLARFSASLTAPPMVLMTGCAGDALREQAYRLGAVAVLEKPFDLGSLRESIELAFTRRDARSRGDW
jgi:CheY-like chemotaxis protein